MMLASAHAAAVPTPRQNEGPFYPTGFPAGMANDLVQVRGQQARAMGQVPHLEGRAIGIDGGGGRPGALATTMDIVIA